MHNSNAQNKWLKDFVIEVRDGAMQDFKLSN